MQWTQEKRAHSNTSKAVSACAICLSPKMEGHKLWNANHAPETHADLDLILLKTMLRRNSRRSITSALSPQTQSGILTTRYLLLRPTFFSLT